MKYRKLAALALSVVLGITTIPSMAIADDLWFETGDVEAPEVYEEFIPEEYVEEPVIDGTIYTEDFVAAEAGDELVEGTDQLGDGDGEIVIVSLFQVFLVPLADLVNFFHDLLDGIRL